MYKCFNCGSSAVIWDSDFMFEDCGYDGYGIVHFLHCDKCGAEVEYKVPLENEEETEVPDDD